MRSAFKGEQAKAVLSQWFDRFRDRIKVPTESRSVKTRFGDTHVLVGGPEGAPPVVLLHGALASSAHVLGELAPLLERFRVHAVDIVGQSVKSADARPSVSNNEYGEWLSDVLDGLSLPRAHVVGVSWGGFVAIRLAAVAPARIDRLVLLVPAGVVNGSSWEGFTKVGIPMMLYRMSPSEQRLKAFVRHMLTTTDDDWVPYLGDALRSYNMDMRVPALATPEELEGLTAPTLVLGADRDVSFPGQRLLARAPELFPSLAGKELIKDCRHCPPTTDDFRRWLSERISGFLLAS
ncbi:alpha/beta fold hydrolase [Vitiosangium sp. GDMCC 1.1324]|uniref:alpha/beta fold hydrolase n=1 Tax=Vitiosangium sp. (strain GDMCC 1.1324) TaxID=2138576 RepID=UPI000D3C9F0E|nr:alpha/beta hydrolase [Vitiosangium sp. GDMCC 1.1324]PTL85721.1 alpha/beta hydrolase [Vitiosangium sp. GDMCC 1.1324]